MTRDKDRDIIDKMNRTLTEEIETALEKVLALHLKQIIVKLVNLEDRFQKLEKRMDAFEKEQKKQGSAIKRIQKTLDIAIKTFDFEDVRLHKRVQRIENHLGLSRME